ncbi:hypothetical protein BCY91_08845 [Pelobium manganitolerans]|uniref:DUF3298 domain-containing protein n=1 Tax=Pelobium manganitolerans TaxID=1842495 RepID=A0A419S2Z7_9SPHI|nr:DUF3298 and DUF4163 domain-containing protein [Pelobium manganitolerans]RKD13672.1 hypothetical protein BCY91_08845 [Pelobium manganitolerans]
MKNIIIPALALAFLACNNNKTGQQNTDSSSQINENTLTAFSSTDTLPYQIKDFYRETARSKNPADSSKYAYVKASYPKFGADQDFLNRKITSLLSAEPWTGKNQHSLMKASESFFKDFETFKKEVPESPAGYAWEQSITVKFQDTNLIVFASESYVYTGGAHGMPSLLYSNFDLKNEKDIKLEDILIKDYKKPLTRVAESIFRKNEGLSQTDSLENYFFENKVFYLNDNFAVTQKGLLFTYNVYEIKSYAEGMTDLFIPYQKIKGLVKPNSIISKYITP